MDESASSIRASTSKAMNTSSESLAASGLVTAGSSARGATSATNRSVSAEGALGPDPDRRSHDAEAREHDEDAGQDLTRSPPTGALLHRLGLAEAIRSRPAVGHSPLRARMRPGHGRRPAGTACLERRDLGVCSWLCLPRPETYAGTIPATADVMVHSRCFRDITLMG